MGNETYGDICYKISKWFLDSKINLSEDDVFNLDQNFPALCLESINNFIDSGLDAITVLVSDPYIAKRVYLKLKENESKILS